MLWKAEMKIYTPKMRAAALKNAAIYDWAKKLVVEVTEKADFFVKYMDAYYEQIPSEGIPRSATMSTVNAVDSLKFICPYCGMNVQKELKNGLWKIDPITAPWKAACPGCNSLFPSNDFALLYKRGLNEKGEYDRELAAKNNAEAVARGEKDALVNELFPDKDKNWMVDDGFGWSPKDGTYGTLDQSKWAPVAFYHHMFWYSNKGSDTWSISKAIDTLSQAYLYTGKIEYGRAGAVLLDRVADVYPAYTFPRVGIGYSASHGGGYNGKTIGSIWESFIAEILIKGYDAFAPVMGDKEVVRYLSKKAKERNLLNSKTSAELIRNNIKNNIVREAFRAVKEGAIYGNFGMHQKVAALVAVVLDGEEVDEILDWLVKPGGMNKIDYVDPIYGTTVSLRCNNVGGELLDKYIDEIDHDGFGAEVGITYNKLWFINSLEIAEILSRCASNKLDLFKNPKLVKMYDTFIHETIAGGTSLSIGDSGYTVSNVYPFANEMLRCYDVLRDPKMAQYYHFYSGGEIANAYINMFTDPEELVASLKKDIETYGEYQFESDNLTGFGLSVLRVGQHKYNDEKQHDIWMYLGRTASAHAHRDMLQLGVDAYGLNISPDLGYPEATAFQPNRLEWIKATISHNTVVVNGESQTGMYTGKSLHYDSTENVKLVDVDGSGAYEETDIYRRTAVMIAVTDKIGYTLDFFRIKGGDSHMYSFHTQSYMGYTSEDVNWIPQVDGNGNYVGTYASPDVEYGHDPNSSDIVGADKTLYPRGYTWLTHVNKGSVEEGTFSVDFALSDFRNHAKDSDNIHLRYTAINDWIPDSVDMTTGYPPRKKVNDVIPGLDYMFIHRKGHNLDTLYTSLLQPYKGKSYIEKAEYISAVMKVGKKEPDDVVKAVKVTLTNGLCDYVVYATNNKVIYYVTDGNVGFDFKGFVGVYRVDSAGRNAYSYINDGDIIGDMTGVGAYTGTVIDFTKDFVAENSITVQLNQMPEKAEDLEGKYVYVNSTSKRNTVYRIKQVTKSGENYVLHLGNTTVIERMADKNNLGAGYVYAISEGQSIRVPVSIVINNVSQEKQQPGRRCRADD